MKIINIIDSNQPDNNKISNMDLINIQVDYDNGMTGEMSIYRAHYNRLIHEEHMMEKYNIPEKEFHILEDLFEEDYNTSHFYDNED